MDYFGDYTIESASRHPSSTFAPLASLSPTPTSDPSILCVADISPFDTRPPNQRVSCAGSDQCLSSLTRDLSLNRDTPSNTVQHRSSTPPPRTPPSPRAAPCWRRRFQRQANLRLQTDPAHLRSIRDMVRDVTYADVPWAQSNDDAHQPAVNAMAGVLNSLSIRTTDLTDCDRDPDEQPELDPDDGSGSDQSYSPTSTDCGCGNTTIGTRPSALVYAFSSAAGTGKAAYRRSVELSPISPKFGGVTKVRHRRSGPRV